MESLKEMKRSTQTTKLQCGAGKWQLFRSAVEKFRPPVMARGKRGRASTVKKADLADSDEDIQTLRRSGKASFNRDELFQDSEDECMASPSKHTDFVVFKQRDEIMLEGSKWGRKKEDQDYMSASEEEILPLGDISESEDEENDDSEEVSDGQDDDRSLTDEDELEKEDVDKEAWGSSRKAYYGADEASDDEDIALEEREAERLQRKHLARLRPEDFLETWADIPSTVDATKTSTKVVTEALPAPDLSKLSTSQVSKLLNARHPEVAHFATLYHKLHPELSSLSLLAERLYHPQHEIIKLKFALLSILLGSIAMFFAVRADSRDRPSTLKKLTAKITGFELLWDKVSTIIIDRNAGDVQSLVQTEEKFESNLPAGPKPPKTGSETRKRKRTIVKTLADLSSDEEDDLNTTLALLKKSRTAAKSKANRAEANDDLSDFVDATTLHSVDAQDKWANKRTLRFYASQIESKQANRRNKYSGDVEVFKEHGKVKDKRQVEEARKRGQEPTEDEADLDDEEPPAATRADEDDYYDFIKAQAAKKRTSKKEDYEASKAAARAFLQGDEEAELGEGGKRLITRQIEKNKGLMPKRSKDVRNPRVKKRKKYEKRKIALKGQHAVYVANDPRRGAYAGEVSGISKNVVKGIKLS